MQIVEATADDVPAIATIINQAYRGDTSKQGWTTEAWFIAGEKRTDTEDLNKLLQHPKACLLKAVNDDGKMCGCVYLRGEDDTLYLGMLSILPTLQNMGTGKLLMQAAETLAVEQGIRSITLYVIMLRIELIEWYQRLGFKDTGRRIPFPDHAEFGTAMQPLEFIVMEKKLLKH